MNGEGFGETDAVLDCGDGQAPMTSTDSHVRGVLEVFPRYITSSL